MTSSSNSTTSRFGILLPTGCRPDEAEALDQICRGIVARLHGQVIEVFAENNLEPLVAAVRAGAVAAVVYPPHESLIHDPLMVGIVRGVFRGLFGVTLRCAGEPDPPAIPTVLIRAAQRIVENHLRSKHNHSTGFASDNLPLGYRKVGNSVEIDPQQVEQVHAAFREAGLDR